jgi:hypothetical protein
MGWKCGIAPSIVDLCSLLNTAIVTKLRIRWMRGLQRQTRRPLPAETPRYGYVLENDGVPVGCLLLIYSSRTICRPNGHSPQCVKLVCRPGISNLFGDVCANDRRSAITSPIWTSRRQLTRGRSSKFRGSRCIVVADISLCRPCRVSDMA